MKGSVPRCLSAARWWGMTRERRESRLPVGSKKQAPGPREGAVPGPWALTGGGRTASQRPRAAPSAQNGISSAGTSPLAVAGAAAPGARFSKNCTRPPGAIRTSVV